MSVIPIPASAPPDVQDAFRVIDRYLQAWPTTTDVNLSGRRITNAGRAIQPADYATKQDVDDTVQAQNVTTSPDVTFQNITVDGNARFLGQEFFPHFTDGSAHHCLLFVNNNGQLAVDEDHLAYNETANLLEIGFATLLKWFHQAALSSPADGVIAMQNDAGTGFTRLVIGPTATSGHPALAKSGAGILVQTGDGGSDATLTAGALVSHGSITQRDSTVIHSTTALSSNGGGGTGTLNNCPVNGDPVKWLQIDDNGTARYLPVWS